MVYYLYRSFYMKTYCDNHFHIMYPDTLEAFIKESLDLFYQKQPILENVFSCNTSILGQIKISYFTERAQFVKYIQSVSNGKTPPTMASGCTYNGEIQILVNIHDQLSMESKKYTLTHEMVHLYINKSIYEKYHIRRIRWFDESYAKYLDGSIENKTIENWKNMTNQLQHLENFDMNSIQSNHLKTDTYNAYHMFFMIGKYIFENHLEKQYIDLIKKDDSKIREMGPTILTKAITYVMQLYGIE